MICNDFYDEYANTLANGTIWNAVHDHDVAISIELMFEINISFSVWLNPIYSIYFGFLQALYILVTWIVIQFKNLIMQKLLLLYIHLTIIIIAEVSLPGFGSSLNVRMKWSSLIDLHVSEHAGFKNYILILHVCIFLHKIFWSILAYFCIFENESSILAIKKCILLFLKSLEQ